MMMLIAAAWACEPEVCVEQARVARSELRLAESARLFQTACEGGDPDGCAGSSVWGGKLQRLGKALDLIRKDGKETVWQRLSPGKTQAWFIQM